MGMRTGTRPPPPLRQRGVCPRPGQPHTCAASTVSTSTNSGKHTLKKTWVIPRLSVFSPQPECPRLNENGPKSSGKGSPCAPCPTRSRQAALEEGPATEAAVGELNYLLKEKCVIYLFNSRRDSEVSKRREGRA